MIEPTQKPIARFSAGGVSAALWENEITIDGRVATILKASVSRRYKDRNGNWKTTMAFARNELPLAIYCLQKAFETIIEKDTNHEISDAIEEQRVV